MFITKIFEKIFNHSFWKSAFNYSLLTLFSSQTAVETFLLPPPSLFCSLCLRATNLSQFQHASMHYMPLHTSKSQPFLMLCFCLCNWLILGGLQNQFLYLFSGETGILLHYFYLILCLFHVL